MASGLHNSVLDGRALGGERPGRGMYFHRVQAPGRSVVETIRDRALNPATGRAGVRAQHWG